MLKDFRKGKKKQGILNFEEWNPAPIKKKKKKEENVEKEKKVQLQYRNQMQL